MAARASPPLIVLPGALGPLEGGDFAALLGRGRAVRVVAYGADDTLDALIARTIAAADAAGAGRFDLLGQSYGGWIAQCVARAHPGRVRRLVLSHGFALKPRHAWRFRLGRHMLERMPRGLGRRLLLGRAKRTLAPVAAQDPARHARLLAELARRTEQPGFWEGLAAQQRCLEQSLRPPAAARPPLAGNVPVLIVESANDPLLRARDRAALRALYPQAERLRFETAGHVSPLVEGDAYAAAVTAFLDRPDAQAKMTRR